MTTLVINILKTELETFEIHREKLLEETEGAYALVHGRNLVETYKDESDAISEGYRQFGNVPFLVKLIAQVETPANFVNNNVGI